MKLTFEEMCTSVKLCADARESISVVGLDLAQDLGASMWLAFRGKEVLTPGRKYRITVEEIE